MKARSRDARAQQKAVVAAKHGDYLTWHLGDEEPSDEVPMVLSLEEMNTMSTTTTKEEKP